jgi:23S rRNA (guanosine2251-2'-O)-methyltransferase
MEYANIFIITNTASILRSLKENGVWISGLDAKGDTSLFEADLKGDIALVIGGEHKGIRPGVKKECDFLLSIPNQGNINSLNASVAGGIAMYEAFRQRN